MSSLEDIGAATKVLSDDPECAMGGSGSKPEEDETRVSILRKCDGGSDSDAVVSKQVVESEVIVESTIEVNGFEDKLVKNLDEKNEIGENSLLVKNLDEKNEMDENSLLVKNLDEKNEIGESSLPVKNLDEKNEIGENSLLVKDLDEKNEMGENSLLVKNSDEKNEIGENSLVENGECRSTDYKEVNGSGADVMDVDGDGCEGGTDEKMKVEDAGFRVGDFVWGKIKSHPWWPGQVYDPKDASEFAMSRKQEGRLLVAFFGDGSCSWCSPSQLIPFVDNFSEMSIVSSSKSFLNAVQSAVDEVGRLMELEMTCKCIPEEKKDTLAKPEVTNAGLKAGVVVPEVDVCRLSFPKYEAADVLQKVMELAKVVSVGNGLDVAALRSWLSAFYYSKGGHRLPVYHAPFLIEGLEDKSKDVNGAGDDFSVPIEVPILGPQEDDWLSSPTAGSLNSEAPSENKALHKRKQRSVAELMGENKDKKPESRKLASSKEGTDVEKSATTRKRKKDNDGELKVAGSEQPSSTGKKGKKKKSEVTVSPSVSNAKDDGADGSDGANGGKLSVKPMEIDVSAAENDSEAKEDSETMSTPRERKKSKYLSPPYLNPALRASNSSFKSEAHVMKNGATNTAQEGEHTEGRGIADSVANGSQEEKLPNELTGSLSTSVDTGTRTVKDDKKLSFPVSDVDISVNELLTDIQHAALDPLYLRDKGSLDMVWAFVSALRSSTYLHGQDYKLYRKGKKTGGNQKSLPSQQRDVSNEQIKEKTAKSPDQDTSRVSKRQRKSDTEKSKKSAKTSVAKTTTETAEGKTLPCLILKFTLGFPLPSKKDVVQLFSKFGSLNMKETHVEKDSHLIRIAYTNNSDAEAAFKSSVSQCPYGSENVNYSLEGSAAGSKSRKPHPKVLSPAKRAPEKREASPHAVQDLVSDLKTIKQRLEITTAIAENYHMKFSSEDKSSLKDEMKHLMEKSEAVADMVRIIAEKSA